MTITQKAIAFVSRFSFLVSRFSFLVLFLSFNVLLFTSHVSAQVIIKEKVEINPQSIQPDYVPPEYTPCGPWISSYDRLNPWQVVWNNVSFAPDPYQQMFNFQDNRIGPGLQRRTYTIEPDKIYNLTIQQSDEYAYFTYGGFSDNLTGAYVLIQYAGTTLTEIQGSELGAIAWFDYVRDYPSGLYYSNTNKYDMKIKREVPSGTEIVVSLFDGQETINYHTRIEVPTFSIDNDTEEDTLLHYYSREIDFYLNFQQTVGSCQLDGYGGAYPVGIKFNIEIIEGQQYGNLYYPGTVADPEQFGTSITNLDDEYGIGIANYTIKYKADGVQPDSLTPGIVTIKCSANDLDIVPVEVSFPVKYNTDPPEEGEIILVNFNKESFSPGDTATTNCKWLTAYNELLDFPAEQSFNVAITGGSEFGMLLDPNAGSIADNLQGVSNGFKVITATSIPYDSVVIILKVNTTVGGGIASRIINNKKEESADKKEDNEPKSLESIIIGDNEIEGYGDVVVKKDGNWCDSLIICNSTEYLPNVILNQVPNGYSGVDLCNPSNGLKPQGVTQVYWTDTLYTFNIGVCFNSQFQKFWFDINDGNSLKVNYISFICDNLPNDDCNLINDWMGFSTTLNCNQLEDIFIAMYNYGGYTIPEVAPCYFLKKVILSHENEHVKDYQLVIDTEKINFTNSLDSVVINCSVFENINTARSYWIQKIKNEFEEFKVRSKYSFLEFIENKGGLALYEEDVQRRMQVKSVIANEITLVNNFFGCLIQPLFN